MANISHVSLIKKGISEWNAWRKEHPEIEPNFSDTSFSGANLSRIDLIGTDLSRAKLSGANLNRADLIRSNVSYVDLSEANLSGADLSFADFKYTDLSGADLSGAHLIGTNLEGADLRGADLRGADLSDADLSYAQLSQANLSNAIVGYTKFTALVLNEVKGLETVVHNGPSSIGIDTIYRSSGDIPEVFLKGAGIDDHFISYIRSLTNLAIQYYSCFISYSSKDEFFVKRLYADLQANNVRCWFAPQDLKIGDKIRSRIDESIRIYDKLLLVLSEQSVASDWVELEVQAALEKERKEKQIVLFPVRLDDTVMEKSRTWATHIYQTRHIGDFTNWKSHDVYQNAFTRLLRDLKANVQR